MTAVTTKSVFRGGRAVAVGSIVCAVCLALASIGPAITSIDLDESNWQLYTWFRFLFVWIAVSAGLVALSVSIFKPLQKNLIFGFAAVLIGFITSVYPSGLQLFHGVTEITGRIDSIDGVGSSKRMRILPNSKTISTEHQVAMSTVVVNVDGKHQILKVSTRDIFAELAGSNSQQWRIQYLAWLGRFISVEPVIDPSF